MNAPTGTQYELVHDDQRAVVTEVGAGLRSYVVGGRDLVSTFDEDQPPFGCQGQHLMPWPNRIRDGRWVLDGQPQQLPVNEPERNNAIHGLVRDLPFTVVAQTPDSLTQRVVLEPSAGWPGTLELVVTHTLSEAGLGVDVTATNTGEVTVPFGYAAHPYLVAPDDEPLDDCLFTVPFDDWLESDDRLLPVARHAVDGSAMDRRLPAPLDGAELDTAFTAPVAPDGVWEVSLAGSRSATVVWGGPGMDWVQVFTPVDRQSVAVEPMTCGPDAFNEGPTHQGLVRLAPGERTSTTWGIARRVLGPVTAG